MGRLTERWRRVPAFLMVVGLLFTIVGFSQSSAAPLSSGTVGGFEDDGNMAEQAAVPGTLDWSTVTATTVAVTDDTTDTGYVGTSKENEPEGFVCNTGGANPPKNNILSAYVNTRITGPPTQDPPTAFLDLGYVRQVGQGDAHVNFEFNRNPITNLCPYTGRTTGDLLITFDFPGGSGVANIQTFKWNATAGPGGLGDWIEFALPAGAAAGASNASAFTNVFNGLNVGEREFGEATVDLVALNNLVGGILQCPGFGSLNIRSRSSGESFNSALQDRLPQTAIDLSTCGSLKLKKVDDKGNPLADAVFGLFDNANATGTPVQTCTSDANGICQFSSVTPGSYWVKEISAPAGYDVDPDIVPVTIGFRQAVDITGTPFVDPRQTGFVRIHKVLHDLAGNTITPSDPNALNGTTFLMYEDGNGDGAYQAGEEAHLWSDGSVATCTITGGTGSCDIGPLATGDYRISETVAPHGSSSAGDVDVTVTQGTAQVPVHVDFVNVLSPINISLDKAGQDTANVGDVITYTFDVTTTGPRLHDISLVELVDVCTGNPVYQSGDDGDGYLEAGETWHYTCTHTVTMADPDPLVNTARVTGTDDYGRTTTAQDSHTVDILHPDVTITKVAVDDSISAGDIASFVITVTVGGEPGSIARNLHIDDPLPGGLAWSENSSACDITNGNLHCSFGHVAYGQTRSVTVSAQTSGVTCGDLVNTATVGATNELPSAQGNNTATDTIHVSCPDVSVLKLADVSTINAGDTAQFTIIVTNNDANGTATNVTLNDALPAGIVWSEDSDDCSISNNTLSCSFGDLGPGATRTVHVSGATDAADCGILSNTATVASTNEGAGLQGNNSSTAFLTVLCPDVSVVKTADASPINAGDPAGFTITVSSNGPGLAKNVTLSDPLPSGVAWSEDSAACSIAGNTLSCDFGDMPSGSSAVVHVTGTTDPADCGTLTNTATVASSNEPASAEANNSSTATITVNCPDLSILKSADDGIVSAGDQVGFTITLTNAGPGVAYNATIDDPLPSDAGLSWSIAGTTPPGAQCSITSGTLHCDLGSLAAGASVSVHVVSPTTPATCGDLTNTATGDASNDDAVESSASATVLCPGLNFTKSPDSGLVDAGEDAVFTLTVVNAGPGDAHDVVIDDDLPSGLNWSVNDDRCSIAADHLHCELGDMAAGATIVIEVSAPTDESDCGVLDNVGNVTSSNGDPLDDDGHIRVRCPIDILIDKTGPDQVHVGDTITYTMEVTNTGGEDLVSVTLTDPVCDAGSITRIDDGDGDSVLAVGETWIYTCTHVVTATDVDPLPNVATVVGSDTDDRSTSDTDDHVVDILHPAISIVKTANPVSVDPGSSVTFTYDVTNTGDTTLLDVVVVDDILGLIGTIPVLAPGQTVTLTKTVTVQADSPTRNVGTATGHDSLDKEVSASDDAIITIVAPREIPRELPRTGGDPGLLLLTGLSMMLGGGLLLTGRRVLLLFVGRRIR